MTLEEKLVEDVKAKAKQVLVVPEEQPKTEGKPDPAQVPFEKRQRENEVIQTLRKDVQSRIAGLPETVDRSGFPNLDEVPREAWLQGPEYVFGSILHRVKATLHQSTNLKIREAEVATAKNIGPLTDQIDKENVRISTSLGQEVKRLAAEKEAKIRESRQAIAEEYNKKILEAQARFGREKLDGLQAERKKVTDGFETTKKDLLDATTNSITAITIALTPPPKPERVSRFAQKASLPLVVAAIIEVGSGGDPKVG